MSAFHAALRAPRALALGAALVLAGCAAQSPAVDSPEVARIGDEAITLSELDDWIKDQLFEEASESRNPGKLYELRQGALDRLVDERAVEQAARDRGVDRELLLEQEIEALGPVTDEEVNAFFQANRERIPPEATFEAIAPDIRRHLQSLRADEAAGAVRARASVRMLLEPPRAEIAASGPSKGPDDALVTVIEFSDYQCPFCKRAEPTMDALLQRYPEQVRVVYRHLPLDFHENAKPAAIAAVCAEDQDQFWPYHGLLFQNQQALGADALRSYAQQLSLDLAAFDACLASPESAARVERDMREANGAGASGTPAFFVNGILLTGARPVEAFAEIVDRELERLGRQ